MSAFNPWEFTRGAPKTPGFARAVFDYAVASEPARPLLQNGPLLTDNLTTATTRLRQATTLAAHLASQVESIRTTTPIGFTAGSSHNGVSRPVEVTVEGLVTRGVTDAVIESRRLLQQAAEITERACRSLERARDAWESPTVS